MKKFLFILFFLPVLANGQSPHSWAWYFGEYVNLGVDETAHRGYDNTSANMALITERDSVWYAAGGSHHGFIVAGYDSSAYGKYDNSAGQLGLGNKTGTGSFTKITVDSLGNPFHGVKQLICAGTNYSPYWSTTALAHDTVFVWGNTQGGNEGNGTFGCNASTRPVPVIIPGGRLVSKIQAGIGMVALCTDGTVWTWGANGDVYANARGGSPAFMSPGQVTLPGGRTAVDISGSGGDFWYIILDNGHILGCGINGDYLGNVGSVQNTPQDITSTLNLPFGISKIDVNQACTYVILTDGSLWAWGSNAMGTIGDGTELDYSRYGCCPFPYGTTTLYPYANSQGLHENMYLHPVQVMPGLHSFTKIYTNKALTWSVAVKTSDNYLIAWGRNKSGSLPNGITGANPVNGAISSKYPNSWDVPAPTRMYPDSVSGVIQVTCPYCLTHSTTECNTYTNPTAAAPVVHVGANQSLASGTTTTTLVGLCIPASGYKLFQPYTWTISGPNTPLMTLPTDPNPVLTGMVDGTYTATLTSTDQNLRTSSASMTITIGNVAPTVTPGGPYTIALPTNSQAISVTATGNGGATITSYAWTKTSGPGSTTITGNTTATPTVSGLQQGSYVFHCVVTDSNGLTTPADVNVTVNAAAGNCHCLILNY